MDNPTVCDLHLHLPCLDPVGGEPLMTDAWPVRRQTYGYLPSYKASPPIGWYQIILLGDRGICVCVNKLPRVALDSGETVLHTEKVTDVQYCSLRHN